MTERKESRSRWSFPSTSIVAAAPFALMAAFAWAGGWFDPSRLSGSELTDALKDGPGTHPGFRSAHAKGLCFSGQFDANGAGVALSKASVFARGSYPVVGRFSLGGGNPLATDGRNVFRAMALRIDMAGGQEWRIAMDHTPIFPVATPAAFVELQRASRPDPSTGKPDPKAMDAYLARHPETKAFQKYLKDAPLPDSFANSGYHSINAFRFTDGKGQTRLVRWSMLPETPMVSLDKAKLDALPINFLFDDIIMRLRSTPIRWRLAVTVA
ncbi:MAG: catalase family peroxidase, partial [Burkholderiaceae bacterium]|nr:catalase family peroxidase [Burkholderiaceae bacterium]